MRALESIRSALAGGRAGRGAGPIGLELASEMLHLVQFEPAGEKPRIRAARSLPYPDGHDAALASPNALKTLLRAALGSRPFRGHRVVTALAAPTVKLMVLNYTLKDGQSEPERILKLVEERVGESPENLVIDYLPIRMVGEEERELSALVAVAPREKVIAHLERLRQAGLEVHALEIAPVALRRVLSAAQIVNPQENTLTIYCGRERSHLTVLWGRRLVLYREIEFGEKQALEQLTKALDITAEAALTLLYRYGVQPPGSGERAGDDPAAAFETAETLLEILKPAFYALAEHVDRAAVYTASKSRGASPDRICLLGEIARWPRADRLLESLVSIPVYSLDPREAFSLGADAATAVDLEPSGGIAMAAGLALRGVVDDG